MAERLMIRRLRGRGRVLLIALILSAAHLPPAPANAGITEELRSLGWEEIVFDDFAPNRWTGIPNGVRVRSDRSVSIIFRPVAVDLPKTPVLRWRWRTSAPPVPTDLTRTKGEDRAIALYVAFPYEPERAGFWESLKRTAVVALRGKDAPGRVLTYVWGGDKPRGTLQHRDGREGLDAIRILRTSSDPAQVWMTEQVDVAADFHSVFGWDAPNPTHIGIVSDSDDTGRAIDASIADIVFGEPGPGTRDEGRKPPSK